MGRIFDALQRNQQNQPNGTHDPLMDEINSTPAADNNFELPERIGSPASPRSNQGGVLSYIPEELLESPAQRPSNSYEEGLYHDGDHHSQPASVRALSQTDFKGAAPAVSSIQSKRRYEPPQTIEPAVRVSLPLDINRIHPRLIAVTEPQSIVSEQYRTLRTQVFHEAERRLTQVIVVTSAIAGEGKTSTSLNLAWAISHSKGRRVLLIDSDLRRPSVSSYLGISPALGLGELLSNGCDLFDPIIRLHGKSTTPDLTDEYQLYVMPTKSEVRNPTELLSGSNIGRIIAELRRYFDYIIIDSPPVTPFADARLLANHADAALLVIRSGAAPYSTVERGIDALSPARILGVVLNGATEDEDNGYYYEYYYSEGKQAEALPQSKIRRLAEKFGLVGRNRASHDMQHRTTNDEEFD
jgi:non-specific protein-tyrosine kinase